MDHLWTPWRYAYIKRDANTDAAETCVFCRLLQADGADADKFILHRAEHNFIVLNIYPYISGHLMIVPYEHVGELAEAAKETTDEMMDLTKRAQSILREVYQPHGFNLGMNLGKAAGAGVAGHIHLHLMPRWTGDANFMSTVGETRVIPEDLALTFQRLTPHFKT